MNASFLTVPELAQVLGSPVHKVADLFRQEDLVRGPGGRKGIPPRLARERLQENGREYAFRVLAHVNLRGGVGKTISTVTLAVRAAQYGFLTCVLDLDPQGSSSLAFDQTPEEEDPIFYDVWKNPSQMTWGALKPVREHLFLLPSSLDNSLLDSALANPASQKNAVKGVCGALEKMGFHLVVIDCPPSLNSAVVSTVCASDLLVIPVSSDAFSFKGLDLTLREVASICDSFGLKSPAIQVLYTRYDRREAVSERALRRLQDEYGSYMIPAVVRTSTDYSKALEERISIFDTGRKSKAREDYDRYARHVLGLEGLTG